MMSRWIVFAEYGGEGFEVEVQDPELETEGQVVADVLEYIQIWAREVEDV
jgi:hypothetical protein